MTRFTANMPRIRTGAVFSPSTFQFTMPYESSSGEKPVVGSPASSFQTRRTVFVTLQSSGLIAPEP